MATTLNDTTVFYGKDLEGFYSTALIKGVSKERFRLISDVKDKVKVASLNLSNIVQAGACAFTPTGTVDLAQKTITVCDMMVNLQLCIKDFEQNYLSLKMRSGSSNSDIPQDFVTYLVDRIMKEISKQLEVTVWQGNPDGSPVVGLCQGLLELFDNDATVIDVNGTTLSASNIIAEISKVINAIPDAIVNDELILFVSPAAAKFYAQAQAAAATGQGLYYLDSKKMTFLGYEIVAAPGMPTNVMVMANAAENLVYATDLTNDESNITIKNMDTVTLDKYVRFRTDWKFSVDYLKGAEVVYYH